MDTCQSLQFGCLHLQVTLPACSASPETQLQMQPPNRSDTNIPLMHAAGASPAGCSSVQLPAHPSLAHGPAYPPVEVRSRRSCQLMLDSWPTQCTAKHGAVHVLQVHCTFCSAGDRPANGCLLVGAHKPPRSPMLSTSAAQAHPCKLSWLCTCASADHTSCLCLPRLTHNRLVTDKSPMDERHPMQVPASQQGVLPSPCPTALGAGPIQDTTHLHTQSKHTACWCRWRHNSKQHVVRQSAGHQSQSCSPLTDTPLTHLPCTSCANKATAHGR
jgi:hypothetical protein